MLIINTAAGRPGRLRTQDGKQFAGELSLTSGAVSVSNGTNVTSVSATNLSELNFDTENLQPSAHAERGAGIGLLGLYFANTNIGGTVRFRIDPRIDFDWGLEEPLDGIGKDYFGVIWMGEVEAPDSGEFTLSLSSDDGGRLQVGEQISATGVGKTNASEAAATVQMEKGRKYPLMAFYFDYLGAARARLTWSGPNLPRSLIPADRLYPASYITEHQAKIAGTNGWLATYYASNDFTGSSFTRIEPALNASTNRAARWTTRLLPMVTEPATFYVATDANLRVKVNGKILLQTSAQTQLRESKATLPLSVGESYDLEVESSSGGAIRLLWSAPSHSKSPIPETYLFPFATRLSALGPDFRSPVGVVFCNGSFVAGKVEGADTDTVQCARLLAGNSIRTRDIARIICQPIPPALAARLLPERPGILLANGDFMEGEFQSLEANRIQLDSVLFGRRTLNATHQVLAIILRPLQPATGPYELHLKDESILSAQKLEIENGKLALTDSFLGKVSLPVESVVRLVKR